MEVIKFLAAQPSITDGLAELQQQFGIKAKIYEDDDIICLNYNQIESPKTHPIVMECRSLIIDTSLNIVSRSFDRFFNLGEALNVMPVIDWSKAEVYEKVDGSLIKIYHYNNKWHVATRGTAYAESDCMGYGVTFKELVYKAIHVETDEEFQDVCKDSVLNPNITYIFELTCIENRVVKHYSGYDLTFLAARRNDSGVYVSESEAEWLFDSAISDIASLGNRIRRAKRYSFTSSEDAVNSAAQLKDLDEGYIVYQNGVPVCKIKSPAYVAVHHIRGEGLNPKRISELVLSGEEEEYLTYFPEDRPIIEPYIEGKACLQFSMTNHYEGVEGIEDQKQFALAIKGCVYSAVLFNARNKGISAIDSFNQQRMSYKIDLLKRFVE